MTPLDTLRQGTLDWFKKNPTSEPANICICSKEFAEALRKEINESGMTFFKTDDYRRPRPPMQVNGCNILTSPDVPHPVFAYTDAFSQA